MGKLLDRLQASVTHGEITDVIEEWTCKRGEIGVYGAEEDGKRVFVAAIRNGNNVKANKYTDLQIQNMLATIRSIAEVCGAQKAPHLVLAKPLPLEESPPPMDQTVKSLQNGMP